MSKKFKHDETSPLGEIVKLTSIEERLMLRFDNYKDRLRRTPLVDHDTLQFKCTRFPDKTCHLCFNVMKMTPYFNNGQLNPYFVLKRIKYNQFTKPLLIRLHTDCANKLIWKIATKQAYSVTTIPKEVRSVIRDVLLRFYRRDLNRIVVASTPKFELNN